MGATLTLEQVLDAAITNRLRETWTMLVGRVTGVGLSGTATVQPLPNDIQNGEQVALPSITARVCFPALSAGIVYPVEVGDVGLLVFSCRPVGALVQSGVGSVELRDTRTHSLSDGFFLPLGALAAPPALRLPVARDGDAVTIGADWLAWFATVGTIIGTPPPSAALPPNPTIGTVGASSNVEAT